MPDTLPPCALWLLQLWWVRGVANANFMYGMNLAWAAWQVLFMVQLVKLTARLEAETVQQAQQAEQAQAA